jgi:hypothetical protein
MEIAGLGGSKKKEDIGNKRRNSKTITVIMLVVSSIFAVENSFILLILEIQTLIKWLFNLKKKRFK